MLVTDAKRLRFLATMLVISALNFGHESMKRQPDDLIALMLVYAVFAMTVPKAIILWTAADPEKVERSGWRMRKT